jgi:chemotaxis signal transduction protein
VDIGLIVEEVQEVIPIEDSEIQTPTLASEDGASGFIKAIGYPQEMIKQLLDINKIFEVDEIGV